MEAFNQVPDPLYGGNRLRFFNVEEPLTLSAKDFETEWKEIDNIWVQFGSTKSLKKDSGWTKTYDCQFKKRQASSTKNPNLPIVK
jgi:hypothetical protein